MGTNDLLSKSKTDACALTLRSEVWREDLLPQIGRHSRAIIFYLEFPGLPRFTPRCRK